MDFLPIFLNIQQQSCLVVGGGATATRKVDLLLQAHAKVTIVSPTLTTQLEKYANEDKVRYCDRTFQDTDLSGYCLVIAATNDRAVNEQVSKLAKMQNLPVNVVDQPDLCSFIMPSIIDRSPVQIAISTGGASPVLARLLRAKLEAVVPATYGQLASFVAKFRTKVKENFAPKQRRKFWENVLQGPIAEMLLAGHTRQAHDALNSAIEAPMDDKEYGEVYLVGGGPGDPDLLTFKALRLMQQADVVVYDRLVSEEVLNLSRRDAERIYVGKQPNNHTLSQEEINRLLSKLAQQGKKVLRLKGGDPFIFGRGGEEIETLMEDGVPFQVVPAITAALGASSYAGIPLTHRDYAQSCLFVTGHLKNDSLDLNWQALVQPQQTVVIYMGLKALPFLCEQLIAHGLPADKPAALVQKATTRDQKVLIGTVSTLPEIVAEAHIKLQSLIIIGDVVCLHEKLDWFSPPTE